jgi:hypothetical protein
MTQTILIRGGSVRGFVKRKKYGRAHQGMRSAEYRYELQFK